MDGNRRFPMCAQPACWKLRVECLREAPCALFGMKYALYKYRWIECRNVLWIFSINQTLGYPAWSVSVPEAFPNRRRPGLIKFKFVYSGVKTLRLLQRLVAGYSVFRVLSPKTKLKPRKILNCVTQFRENEKNGCGYFQKITRKTCSTTDNNINQRSCRYVRGACLRVRASRHAGRKFK